MRCEYSALTRARLPGQNHPPGPTPGPLFPLLFVFPSLFRPQNPPKSNHSRTSAAFARKSNHSHTYANRGVGLSIFIVTYLKYVGAPTFPFRPASEGRVLHRQEEPRNQPKGWPLQRHRAGRLGRRALQRGRRPWAESMRWLGSLARQAATRSSTGVGMEGLLCEGGRGEDESTWLQTAWRDSPAKGE